MKSDNKFSIKLFFKSKFNIYSTKYPEIDLLSLILRQKLNQMK